MIISMLLARTSESLCFGPICNAIKPTSTNGDVLSLMGAVIARGFMIALGIAGLLLLMYLIWGGIDWIVSEGDKEKLSKAQHKITNAIIGIIVVAISLTIFVTVGGILGIVQSGPGGFSFTLPQLFPTSP